MTLSSFESSLADGPHFQLQQLLGVWEGTTRTWFEPGKLADESPAGGVIRPLLDGRFVIHEYQGTLMGQPLQGQAILGCHLETGRYQMAWIDNQHMGTGIMFLEGTAVEGGFSVLGSYAAGDGPPWGWRTEFLLADDDRLAIVAYNITPEGLEAKAVETLYRRAG